MISQKFPKRRKILSSSDFKRILEIGQKYRTNSFTVFLCPSAEQKGRIGISISKKVGKAHVRNRIRRRIREAFRRQEDLPPFDWVFLGRASAARANNKELFQEVNDLFNRFIHKV